MRLALIFLSWIAAAQMAMANDICDDLWFTRNLLFDRAGYCFTSPLGRAVFDNAACTTNDPGLDAQQQDVLEQVLAREKQMDCKVNSARTKLDVSLPSWRMSLLDLPIAGEGFACKGWKGASLPMYNAMHVDSHVLGHLARGDLLFLEHDAAKDLDGQHWDLVTQSRNAEITALGWVRFPTDSFPNKCEMTYP